MCCHWFLIQRSLTGNKKNGNGYLPRTCRHQFSVRDVQTKAKRIQILFTVRVRPIVSNTARPNRSLNRTLHSMPAFGLAFHASPNTVLLFRAG